MSPADPQQRSSSYFGLIDQLRHRHPSLFYLKNWATRQRGSSAYPVRAAVLEFQVDKVFRIDFDGKGARNSSRQLADYLADISPDKCKYRLYLLEDLDVPHIEVLGAYLNIDGTVLASQIRDTHWEGGWEIGNTPQLPSFRDPNKSFTLKYYEPRYFLNPNMPEFSSSLRTMSNIPRQITFGARRGPGSLGMIRRNTSFWSRKEDDGSWNGILLLDPPISGDDFKFAGKDTSVSFKNRPFQAGYRNFSAWPDKSAFPLSTEEIRGPQRASLLDDICFYWTTSASPSQIDRAIKSPYESSLFLRNIVAATWMKTLEHLRATLSALEMKLWAIEHIVSPTITEVEKARYLSDFMPTLNELNTMRRRGNWYITEMKINLEGLGISPDFPPLASSQQTGERNHDYDFLAIYAQLQTYQAWTEKYMEVISAQITTMETRKSLADSKSLSRLTVLGFIFLPLSFTATFFSMGGEFAVGQNKFWVYFAVAVPMSLLVFFSAIVQWRRWLHRLKELDWRRAL